VALSKDPHDRHLRDLLSEAAAKAALSATPAERLLPVEHSLGLKQDTVWPARCGLLGFLVSFVLALLQPPGATNNPVFNIMLALGGSGLGAGLGLTVGMIRASRRRDLLAPPELPVIVYLDTETHTYAGLPVRLQSCVHACESVAVS